jgi:hypothetical protein
MGAGRHFQHDAARAEANDAAYLEQLAAAVCLLSACYPVVEGWADISTPVALHEQEQSHWRNAPDRPSPRNAVALRTLQGRKMAQEGE